MTALDESAAPLSDLTPEDPVAAPPLLDLAGLYPACFDWQNPRPLKLRIRHELIALGYPKAAVERTLAAYCMTQPYIDALMVVGTPRIDLQGQPVGEVTKKEVSGARRLLAKGRRVCSWRSALPKLPKDIALTQENIVPGRLELILKFSEVPKAMPVKNGMKIGIQTEDALIVTTLTIRSWNKLMKAASQFPQWIATISGKLGAKTGADGKAVVVLEQPAVQVFEKKPKPPKD